MWSRLSIMFYPINHQKPFWTIVQVWLQINIWSFFSILTELV